jgi:hypothetical protein
MLFAVRPDDYKGQNVLFFPPTKNFVIEDGTFSKILYSTGEYSIYGLLLADSFEFQQQERNGNKGVVKMEAGPVLQHIEQDLLNQYALWRGETTARKRQMPKLDTNCSKIRFHYDKLDAATLTSPCALCLKITGIWEQPQQYGLTLKWMPIQKFDI